MTEKYKIEKDKILDQYIVWENHKNLKIEVYRDKLKKNCKLWVKENGEK